MSNPPNTKDFAAWINLMPGSPSRLYVVGKVETNAQNLVPRLTRTVPQGTNPTILFVDLTIVPDGIGPQVVSYQDVRYEETATQGQYSEVAILWEGEPMLCLQVSEAH